MAIQILNRKKAKKVDFMQFLSGVPARDYVFQRTPYEEQVKEAAELLKAADAVLIGAGAGLSTAAGMNYGGKRFTDNFGEFIEKYGSAMTDMYSAGFYPFPTEEEKWGYWSKHVCLNRIWPDALPLYREVCDLVKDTPHFVLTTNVDHSSGKRDLRMKISSPLRVIMGRSSAPEGVMTRCMTPSICFWRWIRRGKTVRFRLHWCRNARSAAGIWRCTSGAISIS